MNHLLSIEDLDRAGLGSGCHSFDFAPPAGLSFAPNAVEVRRSLDGVVLPRSDWRVVAVQDRRLPAIG